MQPKDYYKILGVSEHADAAELKRAFRKIARESHPDRNPGDAAAEERFKEASEAYEVLGNSEKRTKYDALRKYGFSEAGFGPGAGRGGMSGFPGGVHIRFKSGNVEEMDFADIFSEDSPFSGMFEQIFQQMGMASHRSGRSRRTTFSRSGEKNGSYGHPGQGSSMDSFFRADGLDVHCTVWLKLEQLEKGAKVKVRTPSGKKAMIRVPANTKIKSVFRLPGMGLSSGDRRGDQYVHLEAVA